MSQSDSSLFIIHKGNVTLYILVYVDDIIITGSHISIIQKCIHDLSSRFSLKDLGPINYFLGVEVLSRPDGFVLSQAKYINDLLHETNMHECNGAITPMSDSLALTINPNEPSLNITDYRRLIGKLQYLAFTRPDLAYVVNKLSQFMHCPQHSHWQAVKRLLRYLKATSMYGLQIRRSSISQLHVYSDSDWAGDVLDRTSTSGYVVYYGVTPISWSSKKQKTVARSSTKAEYRAVAGALAETNWISNLLHELRISLVSKPVIYYDNVSATYLCHIHVFYSRMKHIAIDFHFVRDQVQKKLVTVTHILSSEQVADTLTKPLPKAVVQRHFHKLSVIDTTPILRGDDKDKSHALVS